MQDFRKKTTLAIVSLLMAVGFSAATVNAQEATPSASPAADAGVCGVSTPEENITLVESLYTAIDESDTETIDTILADDLVQNMDRYGLEDDATTNDDEIALIAAQEEFYPGSTTEITDIFGTEQKVVAATTLTITEHLITGEDVVLDEPIVVEGITIFTIECGEIVSMHGVNDELGLLTGLGIIPAIGTEATPAS